MKHKSSGLEDTVVMSTHNMDVEEYINDALEADDTLADNSTLDDDDTLDAEFIEDEKRDKAARPIQAMVRRWRGRKLAREYGKQCFVKEWDPKQECFMYIDTRRFPPVRTFIKPKWLGDDDLPEERQWRSPPGYRERRQKQRGFALVVHTATYTDERLPDLPFAAAVKGEHLKLKEVGFQSKYSRGLAGPDIPRPRCTGHAKPIHSQFSGAGLGLFMGAQQSTRAQVI